MKILILGCTGFVGSKIVKYLSSIGGQSITAIVHKKPIQKPLENVTYYTTGFEKITYSFLEQGEYDYILHLARIPGKRFGDFGRLYAGMKGGTANRNLLNNINKLQKKPKLVYLSGSLMYGNNPDSYVNEDFAISPVGFARYYLHAEKPIMDAIDRGEDNVMMLRAPWILGEGSWFEQIYIKHLSLKGTVPVYGNAERKMSIITVEDCAAMLWHYALHALYGEVYNIYTFQKVSVADFTSIIEEFSNAEGKLYYSEEQLNTMMDHTTKRSILSEIVLDTKHKQLQSQYSVIHTDLEKYIKDTLAIYDTAKNRAVL